MAKKKTGKVIQMLSPENYIRKKARTLPIDECLVNPEWQEQGFANVIVTRSHTNGNVTACFYLVDLYCLGVKDSFYLFNVTRTEYEEKLGTHEELENYVPISYALAHNIVYAGLEFAEEYEFKPCKDFTSVTQFMLEEDTDDVELIEIECGKDGKPFYVSGPNDDQNKINKVLAQLERTAGPGNYDFLIEDEEDDFDEDDEFIHMSLEEQRNLFRNLYSRRDDLNDDEYEQLRRLTEYVIDKTSSPDLVDKYTEEYLDDFDFEVTDEIFTAEMLGLANQNLSAGTCELFTQIYETATEDVERAKLLLNDFRNETPENPASYFLELIILRTEAAPEYDEKVQEYSNRFPDYPLLKILKLSYLFTTPSEEAEEEFNKLTMQSLFAGRTWIHHIEAYNYLLTLLLGLVHTFDIDRIRGLYEAYNNLELTEVEFEVLDEFIYLVQATLVEQILLEE